MERQWPAIEFETLAWESDLDVLSGSAFGVYLIDTSSWVYDAWLPGSFGWIGGLPMPCGFPVLLGMSLLMYLAFLLFETARRRIAAKLKGLARG